jgi:hypothetical protein
MARGPQFPGPQMRGTRGTHFVVNLRQKQERREDGAPVSQHECREDGVPWVRSVAAGARPAVLPDAAGIYWVHGLAFFAAEGLAEGVEILDGAVDAPAAW